MEENVVIKNEQALDTQTNFIINNLVELKEEPEEEDFYVKQECDDDKSIKIEFEDYSPTCCEGENWFNDKCFEIEEEAVIKSEPVSDIDKNETLIKKGIGIEAINSSIYEFSVINKDGTIKSEEDLSEEFLNFNPNHEVEIIGEKPCKIEKPQQRSGEKPSKSDLLLLELSENNTNETHVYYKCNFCNYKSLKKYVLQKHVLKIHKKKILHKCNKCEYTSTDRRLLNQHQTTHIKAFKCTKCKYRASRKVYLEVHMRTHVNSFYKCYKCEYRGKYKSTVTRHFNAVHLNV